MRNQEKKRDCIKSHKPPKKFPLAFFFLTYIAIRDRVTIIS